MSFEATKVPPLRPSSPGPLSGAFARQQISQQQRSNYHSSSLSTMVSGTVNRTGLHPGGVEYVPFMLRALISRAYVELLRHLPLPRLTIGVFRPQREHTELEEELHERAHIDYDRVAIVRFPRVYHNLGLTLLTGAQIANPSVAALYEDALVYETGSAITSTGAMTAYSGAKTGRSPLDKRIVKEEGSEKEVWWGPVNKPMTPEVSRSQVIFPIRRLWSIDSTYAATPSLKTSKTSKTFNTLNA